MKQNGNDSTGKRTIVDDILPSNKRETKKFDKKILNPKRRCTSIDFIHFCSTFFELEKPTQQNYWTKRSDLKKNESKREKGTSASRRSISQSPVLRSITSFSPFFGYSYGHYHIVVSIFTLISSSPHRNEFKRARSVNERKKKRNGLQFHE